eukprot:13216773-Heterocapsa_arctica.AAC.1
MEAFRCMPGVVTDMCVRNKRRSEGCLVCQPKRVKADAGAASADAGAASRFRTDAGGGTIDA